MKTSMTWMAACLFAAVSMGGEASAAQTNVAVAANFTDPAKEIAAAFKTKTGHEAILSFGSSGQFYTQITQHAPFQVFLSADDERPRKLVDDGLAMSDSRFTYAIGRLVLWSRSPDLVKGEETLKNSAFSKLSICNPVAAPYGAAAIETMKSLKLYVWSYRDRGAFHEAVTNQILDDLVQALAPRYLRLEARFYVRGGIFTTVVAEHRARGWSAPPPVALDTIASQPSVRAG